MQLNAIIAAARALVHPSTAGVPTQPPTLPPVVQRHCTNAAKVERRNLIRLLGRRGAILFLKERASYERMHDSSRGPDEFAVAWSAYDAQHAIPLED